MTDIKEMTNEELITKMLLNYKGHGTGKENYVEIRSELLRRLEEGEKAKEELAQLKAKTSHFETPRPMNADCYEDNYY